MHTDAADRAIPVLVVVEETLRPTFQHIFRSDEPAAEKVVDTRLLVKLDLLGDRDDDAEVAKVVDCAKRDAACSICSAFQFGFVSLKKDITKFISSLLIWVVMGLLRRGEVVVAAAAAEAAAATAAGAGAGRVGRKRGEGE